MTLGAENGQIVFLNGYDDILGGLTFNATTPYALVFIDLGKEPWVVHMPEGEVRGAAHDMWEREITSMTKPGKYVFVGPGQKAPAGAEEAGYTVHETPTNSIFLGIRLIPTDRQKRILMDGLLVGEAMAKAIDFKKTPRLEDAHYLDGSRWDIDTTSPPDQRREHYDALDGRASWFYEAVTNNLAMHGMETGKGQVYLTSYKDTDDEFLDGGSNYTLHIPPNAPAELFWSLTLYEVDGRDIIHNTQKRSDRSSRHDLLKNADGSVDLYFGPDEPKGKEQNWISTEPGRAFFAMLRFYSPGKTLVDRTWILPDIEKAK